MHRASFGEIDKRAVAGVPIATTRVSSAARIVCLTTAATGGFVFVLVNAYSAKLRRQSPAYARLLADSERCTNLPDGAWITYASRLLGYHDIGRCPGPDLMEQTCALAAREGVPIFLLGGGPGVAEALADVLRRRRPGLVVAGTATPPFGEWSEETNRALVDAVKASGARILFMGVSAPKQEIWAYEHVDELGIPIVCVGAAFDFLSGRKPRAPKWMRKIGLEWLFRLITEPRRLWKRYLIGNLVFLWDVIRFGRRPAPPPPPV